MSGLSELRVNIKLLFVVAHVHFFCYCSLHTFVEAVQWCLAVQKELMRADWPSELLQLPGARVEQDHNGNVRSNSQLNHFSQPVLLFSWFFEESAFAQVCTLVCPTVDRTQSLVEWTILVQL